MTSSKPRINDMASLDTEIRRLKNRCSQIEAQLDDSVEELKDNYGMMAFNSIIGNRLKSVPLLGAVVGTLLGNPTAQAFIQTLIEKLFSKKSGFLEKWISKIF